MSSKYKVILVKANFCSHCKNFLPIYGEAIKLAKKLNPNAEFEIYEMDNEVAPKDMEHMKKLVPLEIKRAMEFSSKYSNLKDKLVGYPTVYLETEESGKKLFGEVEPTALDHKKGGSESKLNTDAAQRFLTNCENCYKTLISGKKDVFITVKGGGTCNTCCGSAVPEESDDIYKNKYLKYKNKYLELKRKL